MRAIERPQLGRQTRNVSLLGRPSPPLARSSNNVSLLRIMRRGTATAPSGAKAGGSRSNPLARLPRVCTSSRLDNRRTRAGRAHAFVLQVRPRARERLSAAGVP